MDFNQFVKLLNKNKPNKELNEGWKDYVIGGLLFTLALNQNNVIGQTNKINNNDNKIIKSATEFSKLNKANKDTLVKQSNDYLNDEITKSLNNKDMIDWTNKVYKSYSEANMIKQMDDAKTQLTYINKIDSLLDIIDNEYEKTKKDDSLYNIIKAKLLTLCFDRVYKTNIEAIKPLINNPPKFLIELNNKIVHMDTTKNYNSNYFSKISSYLNDNSSNLNINIENDEFGFPTPNNKQLSEFDNKLNYLFSLKYGSPIFKKFNFHTNSSKSLNSDSKY